MRRNNGKSPRLDLNLNLSPQAKSGAHGEEGSQQQRRLSTSSSSPSSCVSSEAENGGGPHSPEATSMVLAACPRCLMYVMLAEGDPKCPKCHSAVILDFLHDTTTTKTRKS